MLTGTHIAYYHVCKRKLWLYANGIQMEQTSALVGEGKLLHNQAYAKRANKYIEVQLGNIKIDFYDPDTKTIHETKKTRACQDAHIWQLKYYIYMMQQAGITGVSGILEYPLLKITKPITLTPPDIDYLQQTTQNINQLINQPNCPQKEKKTICQKCSFFDFCWIQDE
ncbi:MAG TPA: CRISPR-associated protein Cas4 [Chitinophagales bacterium]|nr:CRISPR-associated protein Cas4 [Chitinophagales bacterium]